MSQPSKKQKTLQEEIKNETAPTQNKVNKKQNSSIDKQPKHIKTAQAAQKALAIQKAALNQTRHQEEEQEAVQIPTISIKKQSKTKQTTQSTGENDLNFLQNVFGSQQTQAAQPSQLFHSTVEEKITQQKLTQTKPKKISQEKSTNQKTEKAPLKQKQPETEEEKQISSQSLPKSNKKQQESKKIVKPQEQSKKQSTTESTNQQTRIKERKPKEIKQTEKVEKKEELQHEIYVKGLNFDATEEDIKQFFSQCGEVTGVKLIKSTSGWSKGIAFVKFATEDAITSAERLNGAEHMGRQLQVEKTASRQIKIHASASEKKTVFVGNLSFSTTEETLKSFFAKCGGIKDVTIPRTATGEHRGFGYVEFLNTVGATKALLLSTNDLFGRQIRVDIATDRSDREPVQETPRRGRGGFKRGSRGDSSFKQGRSFLTSTPNNRGGHSFRGGSNKRGQSRGRSVEK